MSFMGKAGDNVKWWSASRRAHQDPEWAPVSMEVLVHALTSQGNDLKGPQGQGRHVSQDRLKLRHLRSVFSFPVQEPQGYHANDVDNTEKLIHGFRRDGALPVCFPPKLYFRF